MSAKRNIGLDVFRSVAVINVIACHFIQVSGSPGYLRRNTFTCLGIIGVEMFFVLSGFLIGGIIIKEIPGGQGAPAAILNFWKRRWYRTLPNYFFYLPLAIVLARPWKNHLEHLPRYFCFMQNFAWPVPNTFEVSWSLAIEEWFYLLFPLAVAGMALVPFLRRKRVVAASILFILFGVTMRGFFSGGRVWLSIGMVVIFRLDAIVLGVLLAYIRRESPTLWNILALKRTFVLAVFGFMAAVIYLFSRDFASQQTLSALSGIMLPYAMGFACFLALPYTMTRASLPTWMEKSATHVSAWSYSLYLSHTLAIVILGTIAAKVSILGSLPNSVRLCLALLTAFAMAILTYNFIEKPFLALRDRHTVQ